MNEDMRQILVQTSTAVATIGCFTFVVWVAAHCKSFINKIERDLGFDLPNIEMSDFRNRFFDDGNENLLSDE